jgi:filamentous hemagglutinin family protein
VAPGIDDLGQPATYLIHDGLGEQRGGNLYHSFDQFSVQLGETASRVTGGLRSDIHGTLRSTVPGAALYLMNPAGVLFGEGSSLDVPGSLHVTTGDYLRHADAAGTRFPATATPPATLGIAPIEAFGFLDPDVGPITVQDTRLELSAGETLSLVGGDLEILRFPPGAVPDFGANPLAPENSFTSAVKVPAGRVNLAAVASPGEVLLDDSRADPRLDVDAFETLGRVRMAEQGSINVNGDPGGTVVIRGGEFVIEDDAPYVENGPFGSRLRPRIAINSVTTADTDHSGVALDIDVRGNLILENAQLASGAAGSGRGGDVSIRAGRVLASGPESARGSPPDTTTDPHIVSYTIGSGPSGNVEIVAEELTILDGAQVITVTVGPAGGSAGSISLTANRVTLSRLGSWPYGSLIGSYSFSVGTAGDVRLTGSDPGSELIVEQDAVVTAGASGAGDAGDVYIDFDRVTLDGGAVAANTFGTGNSGSISVTADQVTISGVSPHGMNAQLQAGSLHGDGSPVTGPAPPGYRGGSSGDISLQGRSAGSELIVEGEGFVSTLTTNQADSGSIDIDFDQVTLRDGGWITADTWGLGHGGSVSVTADQLTISGTIGVSSTPPPGFQAGPGGDMALQGSSAESLLVVEQGGLLLAHTTNTGDGGSIDIDFDRVTVQDGGIVFAGTYGPGRGGNISMTADELTISGTSAAGTPSVLSTSTTDQPWATGPAPPDFEAGSGGDIFLHGPSPGSKLIVEGVGIVTALTNNTGDGGNIDIDFDRVTLRDAGRIGARSIGGTGRAGNLTIRARDRFRSTDSSVAALSFASDGGDIQVSASQGVELFNSSITAEVGGGPETTGGNVTVDPDWVILEDGSRIAANAYEGQGGNIDITTRGLFVSSDSTIDASSEFGVSGTVQVNAPDTNLTGSLAPLSERYLEEARLRRDRCETLGREDAGSFVLGVGAGLPEPPDAPLPSFSIGVRNGRNAEP